MIKDILNKKSYINNMWSTMDSAWSLEMAAHAGFDTITIDAQHGLGVDQTQLVPMFQAINTTKTLPLVRVAWPAPHLIMQALDMGAMGIICPMISDEKDTEMFVSSCMYPPDGERSFGPSRPLLRDGSYFQNANSQILKMAMIENKQAYENREKIAGVKNLDGIYIGPYDLSISLDHSKVADFEGELAEVIENILATCQTNGIIAGIHCPNPKVAVKMREKGFKFVTSTTDSNLFRDAMKSVVKDME